ncbi:MAG: 3'(2'),5'-bisphosphate nucleotidase [Anaerolineaceae bacterium]|nr:MAG: 3'(2'),5'-bisphosphate nucleotidase [Anaerolineaceae bacterium]
MFDPYTNEAEVALQAVRTAAQLCRRIQEEMVAEAMVKVDRSPVTVADFASQAVVAHMLHETFAEDPLVAEEDSTSLRTPDQEGTLRAVTGYVSTLYTESKPEMVCEWIDLGSGEPSSRFWVLDPIDGTKGFLRGDQYAVALALVEGGKVVLGGLGCPNLNREMKPDVGGVGAVAIAVRGQGAWVTDMEGGSFRELKVSDRSDPTQARVLRSYAAEHTDTDKIDQLMAALDTPHPPILMDSAAKYGILAAGGGDLLFRLISPQKPDYIESIWDQAVGHILVTEAGGRVSDLSGRDLDFSRGRQLVGNVGVLASNELLHAAALEALKAVGADRRPEGL